MQVPSDLSSAFDCYVVSDRTAWFAEVRALLGLPDLPVYSVREVVGQSFDSILLWTQGEAEGFIPYDLRVDLNRALVGRESLNGPKKIYVSRALSAISRPKYRRLLNENILEDNLRKLNYDVVYPETLSITAQARLFAGAEHIIGLSGSGMINCLFAQPKALVLDIESFTWNVRQHAKLYASGSLEFGFAFGIPVSESAQPVPFRNWSLPSNVMNEALNWME